MKPIFAAILLLIAVGAGAQDSTTQYIQLNARLDAVGNLIVNDIDMPDPKKRAADDTLINYGQIRQLIVKFQKPAMIFNELAKQQWKLLFAVPVENKMSQYESPTIVFYLSRQFITK